MFAKEIAEIDAKLAKTEIVKAEVREKIIAEGLSIVEDIHGTPLTKAAIEAKAMEVALKIKENVDKGLIKNPLLLPVMCGAFDFASLVHQNLMALGVPHEYDCVLVKSYAGTERGKVSILCKSTDELAKRHVIILEDLKETGLSLEKLILFLLKKHVASIGVACLVDKPDNSLASVPIHYPTFTLKKNPFLIGGGMDFFGILRDLPFVGVVSKKALDWIKTTGRLEILKSIPVLNRKRQIYTDCQEGISTLSSFDTILQMLKSPFTALFSLSMFAGKTKPELKFSWVNSPIGITGIEIRPVANNAPDAAPLASARL